MPEFELTREYVVQTVEVLSGVENIGEKTRRREKLYFRYVVYALLDCYFPKSSWAWRGETFGQDHATVIYALNKWKEEMLKQKVYKKYVLLYSESMNHINTLLSSLTNSIEIVKNFNEQNSDEKLKKAINNIIKYALDLTPKTQEI